MRWLLVMVAACGGGGNPDPIGEITVTVFNDGGGTHPIPPSPAPDAFVFVDGSDTVVRTDASGTATIPVTRETSTVHAITQGLNRWYTVVDVPAGARLRFGGQAVIESNIMNVTLPALAGATYRFEGPPSCIASRTSTTPMFTVTYKVNCVNQTVHVYGFAIEPGGQTHVVEGDIQPFSGTPAVLAGPYAIADAITLDVANLPPDTTMLTTTVSNGTTVASMPSVVPITGRSATAMLRAASTANTYRLSVDTASGGTSTWIANGTFPAGTTALDASPMLPPASLVAWQGARAQWTFDATGHAPDGIVVGTSLQAGMTQISWVVHLPGTATELAAPQPPAEIPFTAAPAILPVGIIQYFDNLELDRRFDALGTITTPAVHSITRI